jgi:hypothetical protein
MTGAQYFADTLASNNGNVLVTIGQYNGWRVGMTQVSALCLYLLLCVLYLMCCVQAEATAMRWTCCRCQNNLD